MPKIQQLSSHVADLIAAGEVVERPASAAKELVENAIDAGAKNITVELQNGGMTFLRVTDDGCGIEAEDVETAFLRHATSKLRSAQDLEAIHTLGFRGEALAAIASVSRIDLLTKTADVAFGTSVHLEAGTVTERSEAGCPNGTTIIVRDLFYNTPARLKFMKRDAVEGSALLAAVQRLALAHPEVSIRVIRDGQEQFHTAGDGQLISAIYAVLGRQAAQNLVPVDSHWEANALSGFVSLPTATRGTRGNQIFFVNGRHVRSKSMTAALEEAYKNQIMIGRYPSCVLHLTLPEHLVDVNVHPAKTEVKFLREQEIFDCIHYGVLGALGQVSGRVSMQLPKQESSAVAAPPAPKPKTAKPAPKQEFFRTMTAEDYRAFSEVLKEAPAKPTAAVRSPIPLSETLRTAPAAPPRGNRQKPEAVRTTPAVPAKASTPQPVQQELPLKTQEFRLVGEVLDTYIIVEQGDAVLLIDKHAAHERILFEKFRRQTEPIMSQLLLQPIVCTPDREEAAILLENEALLLQCGFEISDYGNGTVAIRQIPAELTPEQAEVSLTALAGDLLNGKHVDPNTLRDTMLHTVACKAAIKGGRHTDGRELEQLVREVLSRDDIKYCPHGRPVCITLTAKQLERQFKRA